GTPFDACDGGALGPGTQLATGLQVPRRLAFDGTALYVSEQGQFLQNNGRVLRVSIPDGPATPLASPFDTPDAIAVDDSFVYVIDGSGTWRIDKATGAAVTIDASKVNPAAGDTAIASA